MRIETSRWHMAVLIPGKLLYLATPHTASIATIYALARLPGARVTQLTGLEGVDHLYATHHADRDDVTFHNQLSGSEVVVTTVRNPCDLLVTWWLRQPEAVATYIGPEATFEQFVRSVDRVIGVSGPYLADGKIFWHDCDRVLHYETLQEDLDELLIGLDLPTVLLKKHNVTKNKRPWQDYYTEETLAVVRSRFKEEMELYGY